MQERLILTPLQLISLSLVLLLSFAASLGMAFNLDAIVVSFQTSDTIAGLVASAEMGAIACGTLMIIRYANLIDPHRVMLIGVLAIVAANILSIIAPDVIWLGVTRLPAGFALGAVSATVMAVAARSHKPEKTFGFIVASMGGMGMFAAFVLPRALGMHNILPAIYAWSELDGLYIVYILCSICAVIFIRFVPAVRVETGGLTKPAALHISGWFALLGLALIVCGHGILAIFLVKVGRGVGLEPEVIGYVFMGASLIGIGLPIAVGNLGTRIATQVSITVIAVLLIAAGLLVANTKLVIMFFIVAPLFAVLPSAIFPIFLGALSRIDPSGRLVAANQACVMVGSATAPFIGGALSDFGGFGANGWAVAAFVCVGLGLAHPALRRADALR